jgi:hypothetical protein
MSTPGEERRKYNVGAIKLPWRERDIAHAVITPEDMHGYRDIMGADTPDAHPTFPVGANTAYTVELTDHEADLYAAASNLRYLEEAELHEPQRAVGRPTGTLHIPPLDCLAWLRTRYLDLRRWHGRDVRVAILDQGTTAAVREKMGWTLVARTNVADAKLGPGQELVEPDHSHGCLVAPNGVPAGGLLLDCIIGGVSGGSLDSWEAAGIIWAVDNGAKVINLSWNSSAAGTPGQVLQDACAYARNNGGAQITWSAGNNNLTDLQNPAGLSRTNSNVHSIIAFDPATDRRGRFSSHVSDASGCTPGVDSLSLDIFGRPIRWNGTSSAAPHAAMLMAMAMTGGQFTPTQVGAAFKANRRDTGAGASEQGGGAYDLHRALVGLGAGPSVTTSSTNVTHLDSRGVSSTGASSFSLTPAAGVQPDDMQIVVLISSHGANFVLPHGAVLLTDAPYFALYERGMDPVLPVTTSRIRILAVPYTDAQPASMLLSFGGASWISAFGVMTLRGAGGLDPERFVPTTKFGTGGSLDTVPVVPATTSDLQVCIFSQRHPTATTGTLSLPSGLTQRGFWRPSSGTAGYTLLMATRQLTDGNRTPSYISTSNDTTGTWGTCTFTVPAAPPAI